MLDVHVMREAARGCGGAAAAGEACGNDTGVWLEVGEGDAEVGLGLVGRVSWMARWAGMGRVGQMATGSVLKIIGEKVMAASLLGLGKGKDIRSK
jgi:hypothetical protein